MANRYNQGATFAGVTRFTKAPISEVEFSKMTSDPSWYVPFNGGEIVPVYYAEVLPHDTFSIDLDFVIRQTSASLRPTMGKMQVDIFAYFVPNRVVNESWKNVQGENTSGFWSAPEVDLAPLYVPVGVTNESVRIPVGSIADLYGFPTQANIPAEVLEQCNDLKFRGYLEIYNNYFRDQNYQPPIPYSKLNLYNGFLLSKGSLISRSGATPDFIPANSPADGSFAYGALTKAISGEGGSNTNTLAVPSFRTSFSAKEGPLIANKLHDAFTSALPSPQKGPEVYFSPGDLAPVTTGEDINMFAFPLKFKADMGANTAGKTSLIGSALVFGDDGSSRTTGIYPITDGAESQTFADATIDGSNLFADLSEVTGFSINELRTAVATQQVYEQLARSGSRYWSFLKGFFGVEVDDPFPDIPTQIGHMRRDLDLYQVAQTSATESGSSPQGSLTAFGYTTTGGAMFTKTFLEHGYIHILAVVRHRNIYSTYFAPDNFRKSTMDFYLPQFANISEQPIRTAILNPFIENSMETALGYQEAWWEYRYEPDRVHGILRSGVSGSLDVWHFGDYYDDGLQVIDGDWIYSNTRSVLDRTLYIDSSEAPQFISCFNYKVTKQRPMPVYSVPGLDMI